MAKDLIARSAGLPLFTWHDVVRLPLYLAAATLMPLLPRRLDRTIVESLTSVYLWCLGRRVDRLAQKVAMVLGSSVDEQRASIVARDHHRRRLEAFWIRLRGLQPKGWTPEVEVSGAEHLHKSLDSGRGVVVWIMQFCGTVVPKQGLWQAGVRITHVSQAWHGAPWKSRVGLNLVAPLYCLAEDRFLAERVKITAPDVKMCERMGVGRLPQYAILTLRGRLRDARPVSIAGENRGSRNVRAFLFGGSFEIAAGAPTLAWETGATLLTVSARRRGRFRYVVEIHPPIVVDRDAGRAEFARCAVAEFASRLERQVVGHPADWHWGSSLVQDLLQNVRSGSVGEGCRSDRPAKEPQQ